MVELVPISCNLFRYLTGHGPVNVFSYISFSDKCWNAREVRFYQHTLMVSRLSVNLKVV